jgi:uncharacterized membrane protein
MNLTALVQTLHWTHIIVGFVAFFVAPMALISVKGGRRHRQWGKVYFWSMAVVASRALILSLYRPNYFLACVSVFSFYLAFRGYRALGRKPALKNHRSRTVDYAGMIIAFMGSAGLLVLGIVKPAPVWVALGPVAVVFGTVGLFLTLLDLFTFLFPPSDRFEWWYAHMSGMIASYIAAVAAFSVNNFHFLPVLARWLWPTVVGAPLIVFWIICCKKRFRGLSASER